LPRRLQTASENREHNAGDRNRDTDDRFSKESLQETVVSCSAAVSGVLRLTLPKLLDDALWMRRLPPAGQTDLRHGRRRSQRRSSSLDRGVGIAIGAGTDVAVEAGDVVLIRSDPRDVARIITLSKATYRKMMQNLWWAAGYNIVAIPLASGVLAPWGIVLNPAGGAILMSLSTVAVALNAQLLRRVSL